MNSREENDRGLRSYPQGSLESPFVEQELVTKAPDADWGLHLAALEAESSFQSAFEEGSTSLMTPEEASADLEEGQKGIYYEAEGEYEDGEAGEEKALARMKFEIQTGNRIWRNDGKTASLLERKYGPDDFLVDKKGVRLESETNGVLEFETEWFRTWPKLKEAIEKAVKMTDDMNRAASAKYEKTRKAFPFNVDHLRRGSKKEIAQGFWDKKPGMEGEKERILRAGEELEVEIVDAAWKAGIQSSESLLLEYYESFLRQHEWPLYRDGTIKHAKAILDAANTGGMTATEIGKLRSLLQIIVNYIMRGQGGKESQDAGAFTDVKGMPPKQAFTLMSRTNFASIFKVLLTDKEKRLFEKIVKNDSVLKEMGLDRKSPVFIKGYGTKKHEPGPTVHEWLAGIASGVDLLSVRSGKSLSAAMGRYNVETRKGEKDRWLVKLETRNTILGATGIEAKDWTKYASKLFDLASKRERDALNLLHQQSIVDENKLANFVFHARHPELGGRRIQKGERVLAQEWLQIRNDLVRPLLQGVQPELESYPLRPDMEEYSADDEAEDAELEDESWTGLPARDTEGEDEDQAQAQELSLFAADSLGESASAGEEEDPQAQFLDELYGLGLGQVFEGATLERPPQAGLDFSNEGAGQSDGNRLETPGGDASESVAVERFTGPEHRDIGDSASGRESTTIVYGEGGQHLSFGEVVALAGDYFATYDEMRDLARTRMGRARIAWSRWHALDLPKGQEPKVTAEIKDAVREQYYSLASRNLSHFATGGTAWEAYVSWHSKAIADALAAGESSNAQAWRTALTKEAFGHHFLTDMFSAGHVRTPRAAIREWYERNAPDSTDRFLSYMAKFMYDRLDERQQLPPLAWWFSWITKGTIKGRIVKLGGEAVRTFSLGDIVSLALHDLDNRGLQVVSTVDPDARPVQGGFRWTAVGDSHLGSSAAGSLTKRMAVAAAITSLRDLERVRGAGRKLAGRLSSSSQRAAAVKQALGDASRVIFAAGRFVPKEDPTASANVPLPGVARGASRLEWRWGQLGDVAYQAIDQTVKHRIADELFGRLRDIPDPVVATALKIRVSGTRHAFRLFVEHLRAEGIRALEMAVGRRAR